MERLVRLLRAAYETGYLDSENRDSSRFKSSDEDAIIFLFLRNRFARLCCFKHYRQSETDHRTRSVLAMTPSNRQRRMWTRDEDDILRQTADSQANGSS